MWCGGRHRADSLSPFSPLSLVEVVGGLADGGTQGSTVFTGKFWRNLRFEFLFENLRIKFLSDSAVKALSICCPTLLKGCCRGRIYKVVFGGRQGGGPFERETPDFGYHVLLLYGVEARWIGVYSSHSSLQLALTVLSDVHNICTEAR